MIGERAVLRYLILTHTNDARRYQHFVKGGGANLVINLLVAQPTPEKKFPEVVPILRECGISCEEGSPESLKDLIHIAHAFEDQERCCLQTAFGTIRRQCGHSRNLLYTSLRQASNNQAVRQVRWTVPAEHDRRAGCPQVLEFHTHQ